QGRRFPLLERIDPHTEIPRQIQCPGKIASSTPAAPDKTAVDIDTLATAVFGAALILGRDRLVFHPERSIESCVGAVMAFTAPLR
ncbi:MAG: hypothetical protein ABWX89_05485, partial [Paeniglutamicibacter terrestris]